MAFFKCENSFWTEIEWYVKPLMESEKSVHYDIRKLRDDFEWMTTWFNSLELDNNKGPLHWEVDKYKELVKTYMA